MVHAIPHLSLGLPVPLFISGLVLNILLFVRLLSTLKMSSPYYYINFCVQICLLGCTAV
jgi:hypothetical protein